MITIFWALVAAVVYAYAGYPLTVAVAGSLLNRRVRKASLTPRVSVIVAAFNEAEEIEARLTNILASRYPADRLEVVVASDGSTDATVAIASRFDPARVEVLNLSRRGKAAALADGAGHATGEILVFTDANTMFEPDALAMLARNFADPDVGGVAGRTEYVVTHEAESAGRGEDLYWRYDTWLKNLETRTGSVVSAHGGMYAIRRNLFRPVEDPAVTDDFAISTAVVAQGKRLVFERDAVGRERTMVESGPEFQRRVRLMTRGLTGVVLRRRLLNPFRYGFYSIALASRKVLRRLIPLAFPPLALLTFLLASTSTFFAALAAASLAFAALALAGWGLRGTRVGKSPLFYVPFFFCLANLASVFAIWNVMRGLRIERWTPQRHTPAHAAPAASGTVAEAGTP
jgi:cellulose synthase/poly-beta-1,6-N-acetylglucosamine synthase-like glycosyltransferase